MIEKICFVIYNIIFIPAFYILIKVAGLFNKKIKAGIKGRNKLFNELIISINQLDKSKKIIWFHSSSLGEFEQAKPIIEKLKKEKKVNIVVTFFSPSGYENSKKYPYADIVTYIPFDSSSNAKKFVDIIKPSLAVFIRYDLWPNFIRILHKRKINILLVDATMRNNSARKFSIIKTFHKIMFKMINKIFTVSDSDTENFKSFGLNNENVKTIGDTKFDRVYQRSIVAKNKKLLREDIFYNKKIIVAGSTWDEDEEIIIPAFIKLTEYYNDAIIIIAPHEPNLIHLEKIENDFEGKLSTIRFSFLNNYRDEKVIIIDSIGILSTLYYYAKIAFVGGGFKSSIHNVLEPAVYGIPIMFGPKIYNSQEAQKLVMLGGGILLKNKKDFYKTMKTLLLNENLRLEKGIISKKYVENNLGASEKIIAEIYDAI